MSFVSVHDKTVVEAFARKNPLLHAFALGDLDDFYWPHTVWYALQAGEAVQQLALLYTAVSVPALIAMAEQPYTQMRELLWALIPLLPRRFYAHLHPSTVEVFAHDYTVEPRGTLLKMGLRNPSCLDRIDPPAMFQFTAADIPALEACYREHYPENHFTPRMVETGFYFGIRDGGDILSVAGVHVCAPQYRVAVLGNVATDPRWRGRGLARAVCAHLCKALLAHGIEHISLNVKADNTSAIALYRHLGFETMAEFGAYALEGRAS